MAYLTASAAQEFINGIDPGKSKEVTPQQITYEVYNHGQNRYELNCMVDGWVTTGVDGQELKELLTGERKFIDLDWN